MENPLIEFKDVVKRFNGRTVLDRVNLKIYDGHITTIIGKSGAGKSVLLKHIIGLLSPDEGSILYRGNPIEKMSKGEWLDYTRHISYMFQNNALFDSMTVFENVALPLRQTTRLPKGEIAEKVMARIAQTELTEVAHNYPAEISGGMQKRAALARALVTDPKIVLFDEPTTGQDPIRKNAILGMISEYQRKFGFTAVLISHEIPDVFFISNRVVVLYNTKIIFQGTPEEFEGFQHPFQDEFLHSLEAFKEGLTGIYSKRYFKVRYQTDLAKRQSEDTYVVVVFSLEDMNAISETLGHTRAQEIIRSLGAYINKHFGAVGGFTSRQTINEFATVLPYSDLDETTRIMADFTEDLQDHGWREIQTATQGESGNEACFEFTVLAGLAQGKPQIELESVMEFARFKQETIARFVCELPKEAAAGG